MKRIAFFGSSLPTHIGTVVFLACVIMFIGCEKSTESRPELPAVTTASVSEITQTTAQCGGEITSDGGAAVTASGVCWCPDDIPTTDNRSTSDSSGTGGFTSAMTRLTLGTTYNVRAYAVNSAGTGYGEVVTFTTNGPHPPIVTTAPVSSVTYTRVMCGGNIEYDGGDSVAASGVCWSTNPMPTVADDTTNHGTESGSYTSSISGLTEETGYYVRAYATNSYGTGYGEVVSFATAGRVVDVDGNTYRTMRIGDQWWMTENLRAIRYRNGDAIPEVPLPGPWSTTKNGARCAYNNAPGNVSTYGRLYNWYAVNDSRNLAPAGWHVPTDTEWKQMEMFLGMSQEDADAFGLRGTNEGGRLKEIGTDLWLAPNAGATDECGFCGLPGGYRTLGEFGFVRQAGNYYSSTEIVSGPDSGDVCYRALVFNVGKISRHTAPKCFGFSVRCVKD